METLIYLAAAIPFAIIILAVTVLATVRYGLSDTHLQVAILGFVIRKLPLGEIDSVEHLPEQPGRHWSLLHHGGMVVVHMKDGRSLAISPRDAEEFARDLKEKAAISGARKAP